LGAHVITYDPLIQEWMDRLSDLVELGYLTDFIEPMLNIAIGWLRSFGWLVPDLNENWRPVFILGTLYLGAFARNFPDWRKSLLIPAGTIFAITGGLVAGLSGTPGIVAGVLVGSELILFLAVVLDSNKSGGFWILLQSLILAVASVIPELRLLAAIPVTLQLIFAVQSARRGAWLRLGINLYTAALISAALLVSEVSGSGLLLGIAVYIALKAIESLSIGIRSTWSDGLHAVAGDPNTKVGLDTLGVLLGSLFLASIFSTPSIW
jgi:hypothetical protein